MDFKEQCTQLASWVSLSNGNPLTQLGEEANSFIRYRHITKQEIVDFEETNNVKLPQDYSFFLETIGEADLFIPWGFKVISPQKYLENANSTFKNYGEDPFPKILIVINTVSGEMGGFILDESKREYTSFALFRAEVPLEHWLEDNDSYESFSAWLLEEVNDLLDAYS
ncbi:MAG: SMI1/KNR4 family protein [Cellulophaga fucicola]